MYLISADQCFVHSVLDKYVTYIPFVMENAGEYCVPNLKTKMIVPFTLMTSLYSVLSSCILSSLDFNSCDCEEYSCQ